MCHLQREWARQFGDKDKVVGWPSRLFESFLIVVSCLLLTEGHSLREPITERAVCFCGPLASSGKSRLLSLAVVLGYAPGHHCSW